MKDFLTKKNIFKIVVYTIFVLYVFFTAVLFGKYRTVLWYSIENEKTVLGQMEAEQALRNAIKDVTPKTNGAVKTNAKEIAKEVLLNKYSAIITELNK